MKRAEYPATSCREPLGSGAGLVYLCEIVIEHPGPCASFSIPHTVTARDAWEMAHPNWESGVGTKDIIVTSPNFSGEAAKLRAPQEKEPEMTKTYRRFRTSVDPMLHQEGERYLLVEVEGTDRDPLNWTDGLATTQAAWDRARAQAHPVVMIPLAGEPRNLGVVFNPKIFEEKAYQGYVGHGLSMTDGHFGPGSRETWLANFRREVSARCDDLLRICESGHRDLLLMADEVWRDNDASDDVKCALGAYAQAIKEKGI